MMITGDYHHTAIAVARDVGMVSPSAEMIIIDIARQNHNRQNPTFHGQGSIGDGGQSQAGLVPEALEQEGGHTLEVQLSMAQSILGHHPSWGMDAEQEEESSEQKLGSKSAPADGAGREEPAGQDATTLAEVTPSAVPSAEATQEAVSHSGKLSHRHFILKPRRIISTEHSHKKVVLPPLPEDPIFHPSVSSGHSDVSSNALLPSCMSQHSPGRIPDWTPAVQHSVGDHLEVQQTNTPALCPIRHDHRPPPLLIPISHPHQSPASAHPSQPPGQRSMQHEAVPFSGRRPSWQHFTRHSSLGVNPFLGLFTPTGFGSQAPGGRMLGPHCQTPPAAPKPGLAGLRFFQVQGNQDCDGSWALSALAEGQLQCAVTGDALEHMLQLQDTSLLEAVIRNAVVFARMKPHQKGQVMDLLGTAGLYQLLDGQHRRIEVCTATPCCHALPTLLDLTLDLCPLYHVCCVVLCCAVLCCAVMCCVALCCVLVCCAAALWWT